MLRLQGIGNLGKDCVTNTVSGKTVMNFSFAHSEKFKDAQGVQKERTTWVECSYWSERTGIAPYLKKGQLVYVEGTPELRMYTKNDGTPGTSLVLRVMNIQLLGGSVNKTENGGDNSSAGAFAQNKPASVVAEIADTDDLPF